MKNRGAKSFCFWKVLIWLVLVFAGHIVSAANIGIYPGSFDPIHTGHLEVARSALIKLKLDAVYLMPNGTNPRKPNMSPIKARAEIIKAALKEQNLEQIKLFPVEKLKSRLRPAIQKMRQLEFLSLQEKVFPTIVSIKFWGPILFLRFFRDRDTKELIETGAWQSAIGQELKQKR